MGGVALIGISLPVPMAFDAIVTAMLLQAGRIVEFGDVDSTLAAYEKWVAAA